jgi:hypothetical protein
VGRVSQSFSSSAFGECCSPIEYHNRRPDFSNLPNEAGSLLGIVPKEINSVSRKKFQSHESHLPVPMTNLRSSSVIARSSRCQQPRPRLSIPNRGFSSSAPTKRWRTPGPRWRSSAAAIPQFSRAPSRPTTQTSSGGIPSQRPCTSAQTPDSAARILQTGSRTSSTCTARVLTSTRRARRVWWGSIWVARVYEPENQSSPSWEG